MSVGGGIPAADRPCIRSATSRHCGWVGSGRARPANHNRGETKDPYLIILDEQEERIPIRDRDPSIPESIARVIETALADEPEDRFETAAEMGRALRRALQ